MPTRKPKRTNWKQMYEHVSRILLNVQLDRDHWRQKFEQCTRLWREDSESQRDKLAAAERHNAELLKERDIWESANKTVCPGCFRHECRGECMRPVKFHGDKTPEPPPNPCIHDPLGADNYCTICGDKRRLNASLKPKPRSWLRRNWVQLAVMAVVLGAIGFVVWRAWR